MQLFNRDISLSFNLGDFCGIISSGFYIRIALAIQQVQVFVLGGNQGANTIGFSLYNILIFTDCIALFTDNMA